MPRRIYDLWEYRVENVAPWHIIEVWCLRCIHGAIVPHAVLLRGRSGSTFIKDLAFKFRCTACGGCGGFIRVDQKSNAPPAAEPLAGPR